MARPQQRLAGDQPGAPHDGRRLGQGAHRVIGTLLGEGVRHPTAVEILEAVARDPAPRHPNLVYRLAGRQVLAATTAIYFRFFLPGEDWSFVDNEVPVPGGQLDLLFQNPAGEMQADELKTGRSPALIDPSRLDAQVEAELKGGRRKFKELWRGVRVIVTGAPCQSYAVDRDGMPVPLGVAAP